MNSVNPAVCEKMQGHKILCPYGMANGGRREGLKKQPKGWVPIKGWTAENNIKYLMLKSLKKTISLLLVIGLNWAGISAIGSTWAYFSDTETSEGNSMAAGKLDFYLEGKGFNAYDFNQTQTQEEKIKVINDGDNLKFKYSVSVETTSGDDNFCDSLYLSVDLNGSSYYSGSLSGFYNISYIPAPLPGSPDEWDFQITGQNPSAEGACYFDFVFQGWQEEMGSYGNGGFFDEERIGNVVSTETDCGAADHLVINEVYIHSTDDWIELYNPTNKPINLAEGNYRIERSSASGGDPDILLIYGTSSYDAAYPGGIIVPAYGFYLHASNSADNSIKAKADALSNFTLTPDNTLYLANDSVGAPTPLDNSHNNDLDIVDYVGYGNGAKQYEGTDPAPTITDKNSIERGLNGYDSDNNSKDFIIKENPTPTNSSGDGMPKVVINEFLASGNAYDDFVEIYNGSSFIFEAGWAIKIESGGNPTVTINSLPEIAIGDWAVVTLANNSILQSAGIITLYDNSSPVRNEIDKISYYNANTNDSSFARIPDGSPNWVDPIPTPGKTNVTTENLELAGFDPNNFIGGETTLSDVDAIESGGTSSNENGALEEELSSDSNGSAGIDVTDIDTVDIADDSETGSKDSNVSDSDNYDSPDSNMDDSNNDIGGASADDDSNNASADNDNGHTPSPLPTGQAGSQEGNNNPNSSSQEEGNDNPNSSSQEEGNDDGNKNDIVQTASLKDEDIGGFVSDDEIDDITDDNTDIVIKQDGSAREYGASDGSNSGNQGNEADDSDKTSADGDMPIKNDDDATEIIFSA